MRVVRRSPASVSWQPTDSEGEPVAASGAVTVAVTRADGTTLTPADAPAIVSGVASFDLSATELDDLDVLTVTWSLDGDVRGETVVEVVGGVYLTVAEIRALEPSLSDFPTVTLQRCRAEVETRFERSVRSVAFVPRLSTHRFTPELSGRVYVPHYFATELRSARYWSDSAWTTVSVTGSSLHGGLVTLGTGSFPRGYGAEVAYVHGLASPPADVKRAAAAAVRYQAMQERSGLDARAMSYQPTEGGNVVLATAGVGPWEFGLPDVDAVLRSWRERYPPALVA